MSAAMEELLGILDLEQLEHNLASAELELSAEVMEGIEAIHAQYTYPCP